MRTGSAPMPLMPSAVASRLAGSTVRTSTRLSSAAAIARASAALTVVLPTPPLPQQMTTSSDAELAPEPARLLADTPAALGNSGGFLGAHASLLLSASATARVVVSPVRSTMNGTGTTGIGSLLRSSRA